jgi:hypothetical protein
VLDYAAKLAVAAARRLVVSADGSRAYACGSVSVSVEPQRAGANLQGFLQARQRAKVQRKDGRQDGSLAQGAGREISAIKRPKIK